jgi:hypothetical protein
LSQPYPTWQDVFNARRSPFYTGSTRDVLHDRGQNAYLAPSTEAMFTQSNARVLIGQSANGSLRMLALPTQVYPAPTGTGEFGLGPGMYHHFDVVMYAGDLHYQIALEGREVIDLANDQRENQTWYADHYLPMTRADEPDLEIHLVSVAPVAPDAARAALAPAPLPGPAGCLYLLHLKNTGSEPLRGKVILDAGDMLVGHYEDAQPDVRAMNRPEVSLRQRTLILSRPFGAVGIHMHDGQWVSTGDAFQAERAIRLAPGEEMLVETHLAAGSMYAEIMPTIYAFHLRPALEWINRTTAFWQERLGRLSVRADGADEEAQVINETYIRAVLDNFNCLQTDAQGNLIAHWQGAPSHGYGTVWGIDVEPTAVSVVHACPEITLQTMLFFLTRSRVPLGPPDHSVPILVAPLILARQWLMVTGDAGFFQAHPEVVDGLKGIMDELLAMKAPGANLFPSRYSSDGPVGRRYDFGANAKVRYAFDSLAYILNHAGRESEAEPYAQAAQDIRAAVEEHMLADGPFGRQVSGGTNLGEDPGGFYLPEGWLYYDGEDTSSMLAAVYGLCDLDWEPWINYHRYARSLACYHFDPEFGVLNWFPREYFSVEDGTAFFSRLGGSVTPEEMKEAIAVMREAGIDDVTGSVFWWPHGVEYKRSLTRCSQGQGAWAWQYVQQWLGINVDRSATTLTVAPAGMLTGYEWQGFRAGPTQFDIAWEETGVGSRLRVYNHNDTPWKVRTGFRQPGSGATARMAWQERVVSPGEQVVFEYQPTGEAGSQNPALQAMTDAAILARDGEQFSADGRVIFRRYGPALLWGHWDARRQWDLSEMPNALRFVVANLTDEDWTDVSVMLDCPEGWTAQGRQPKHWSLADNLRGGKVRLELGSVPAMSRTVAPFWLLAPGGRGLVNQPDDPVSSHYPSQPGEGLTVLSTEVSQPVSTSFTAVLEVVKVGEKIERELIIPLTILPLKDQYQRL